MNSQDLSNLQEAYLEVYTPERLDEISQKLATKVYARRAANAIEYQTIDDDEADKSEKKANKTLKRITRKHGDLAGKHAERAGDAQTWGRSSMSSNPNAQNKTKRTQKEQVDLYDIILSHLLDEGYAETPEAAEAIMVSMSEEWREDIIEESYISEMRKEDKVAGKKKTPLYIQGVRKRMLRAEPGSGKKWQMSEPENVKNPEASFGRFKQGKDLAGKVMGYGPHPHGEGGRLRGVKKTKGDKSRVANDPGADVKVHLTPKQKVERNRPSADRGDYINRYF